MSARPWDRPRVPVTHPPAADKAQLPSPRVSAMRPPARPGTLAQPGIRGAWQPHALPGAGAAFQKPRNRGLRLFRPSKGPRPSHVCTAEKLVTDRTCAPGKGGVRNAGPALLLKSFNALYLCDWKRYGAPDRKVSTSAKVSSCLSWLLGLRNHPFLSRVLTLGMR